MNTLKNVEKIIKSCGYTFTFTKKRNIKTFISNKEVVEALQKKHRTMDYYRLRIEDFRAKKSLAVARPFVLDSLRLQPLESLIGDGKPDNNTVINAVSTILCEKFNCKQAQFIVNDKGVEGLVGLKIRTGEDNKTALHERELAKHFFDEVEGAFKNFFVYSQDPEDVLSLDKIVQAFGIMGKHYAQENLIKSIFADDLGLDFFFSKEKIYFRGLKLNFNHLSIKDNFS